VGSQCGAARRGRDLGCGSRRGAGAGQGLKLVEWRQPPQCPMADPHATSALADSPIRVTRAPEPGQLSALGVSDWPIWSCGVSTFPWTYDAQETCLLLEGEVCVTPQGGEPVRFGAGDLVVFAAGLRCTWEVTAPVRKHYHFG